MKKKLIIFLLLVSISFKSYSQGENNNWFFGNNAGLNFNFNPPIPIIGSVMNQFESVASISNSSGELLLYTNGVNIWNREHQIMTNGFGLLGSDTTQQALILPHPGNSNLYYLFTMSPVFSSNCNVVYSLIDMSQGTIGINGNPLGVVSTAVKNIPLHDENGMLFTISSEAITSTPNNNNTGYWILIPNGDMLYSFELNDSGFIDNPVASLLPFPSLLNEYSQIKVSPNLPLSLNLPYSNFVSITLWNNVTQSNDIRINSFNNSTGILTNQYSAPISGTNAYSTEFTSNGLLLYAGIKGVGIYVFDLFNINPQTNSRELTNLNLDYGTIQRQINEEMYISCNNNPFLSRIFNPNSFLLSAFLLEDIYLNNTHIRTRFSRLGLPQLITILPLSICLTNRILSGLESNIFSIYNASNSITTNNNYFVNIGQNITLNAGNIITLSSNTIIKAQSNFLAKIEPCVQSFQRSNTNLTVNNIKNTFNNKFINNDFIVYPNPVNTVVTISNNDNILLSDVNISDINGRTVKTVKVNNLSEVEINVSELTAGIYFMNVNTDAGKAVKKFVKN